MPQSDCEQSDYKLSFKLKQHTPLIHFQANQKGATLRATELKPKLDRFLLTKLGNGDYEAGVEIAKQKKWLIGKGEHPALDYKVKIIVSNTRYEPIEYQLLDRQSNDGLKWKKDGKPAMKSLPMFFANMGDDWEDNKKFLSFADSIEVTIFCYDQDLKKILEKYFDLFIFTTNFGTRQSKGYGSFTTENIPTEQELNNQQITFYSFEIDLNNKSYLNIEEPKVHEPSENFKVYSKLFEILDIFSRTYRSGINVGCYYFKSLMHIYAQQKGMTWDKKYFKSIFLNSRKHQAEISRQQQCHNNPEILNFDNIQNPKLLRDLLGLSTLQRWMSYKITLKHDESNQVKRFKSPITYKIIRDSNNKNKFLVYLFLHPIEILNKTFYINGKSINTPEEFDLKAYLDFCFTYDIANHAIKKKYDRKNRKCKCQEVINAKTDKHQQVIENIYNQLKQQVENRKGSNHE